MNQMMPDPKNVEHRLVCDDDGHWECSCGRAGTVRPDDDVDLAADKHINYQEGDSRRDVRN